MRAATFSYSLWTQKLDLIVRNQRSLSEIFDHKDGLLEPHQLQFKHVDEDPSALDGRRILLVVHPAMSKIDFAEGSCSGPETVLKKAACIMGNGNSQR